MPALNDVLTSSLKQGVTVQQLNDLLIGVPNKGVPVALTALNDTSHYALTVKNNDPTNSRALSVLKSDGSSLITADATGVTLASPLHIPAGSIGSTEIADGSIQNVDMAAGAAAANVGALGGVLTGTLPAPGMAAGAAATNVGTLGGVLTGTLPNPGMAAGTAAANLTQGQIGTVIGTKNVATDQWSNAALAAGHNQLPGSAGILTATSLDSNDLTLINVNVVVQVFQPNVGVSAGWGLFIDNALARYGPTLFAATGVSTTAAWVALFLAAGPGSFGSALSAGSHTFELRFYLSGAVTSGVYLRPASQPFIERYQFEILQLRK